MKRILALFLALCIAGSSLAQVSGNVVTESTLYNDFADTRGTPRATDLRDFVKSTPQLAAKLAVNPQSANYTLALTDQGTIILHPSADTSARTFTIPANASVAFPIGTMITIVNEVSAGVITLAITTDTMYLAGSASTTGNRTITAYAVATIVKVTATEWVITGAGIT